MAKIPDNAALEYVHGPSIGDDAAIKALSARARAVLQRFYDEGRVAGLEYLIIPRREKLDAHYVLKDVAAAAGNVFPFVYLCLQHYAEEDLEITAWAQEEGFVEVT